MKIAITGATGQLGTLVINILLNKIPASDLIALVRDTSKAQSFKEQGIEVRHFDYDQADTLSAALLGIDKLLFISANEIGRRSDQHKAIINAAQHANVPHLVYTSVINADTSQLSLAAEHRETEALIKASGLNYTILRNNWYSENYLAGLAQVIETGVLYGAAANGQINSASRLDFAEAAANVLTRDGHLNQTYELAGSTTFTMTDLAAYIAEVSNKAIHYQNLTADEYLQALIQAGLPVYVANVIVDADVQTQQGALFNPSQDLELLLGRPTTSIKQDIANLIRL